MPYPGPCPGQYPGRAAPPTEAATAGGSNSSVPARDPNELPTLASLRRRRRGGDPGMQLHAHVTIRTRAASLLLAVAVATRLLLANAVPPPDASGTWAITETRGGQKCTATLMLQPTKLAQSAADLLRGARVGILTGPSGAAKTDGITVLTAMLPACWSPKFASKLL